MNGNRRIAFDLDETLGVPLIEGSAVVDWQLRPGAAEFLSRLSAHFTLCLWSVSNRSYVDKALKSGLDKWFSESYSWEEIPCTWKDVRRINADFLVDDSAHHQDAAREFGLADSYIVVPAYASPEDNSDPLHWVRIVETAIKAVSQRPGPGLCRGTINIVADDEDHLKDFAEYMP